MDRIQEFPNNHFTLKPIFLTTMPWFIQLFLLAFEPEKSFVEGLSIIILLLFVCVCSCMYRHICTCVYMQVEVWGQPQILSTGCHQPPLNLFLSFAWILLIMLDWLAGKPQRSSCLCLLQHWTLKLGHSAQDLYTGSGCQTWVAILLR